MRSAAVKASNGKGKQTATAKKKNKNAAAQDKIRKNPWRSTTAKPSPFPNPYDNGPRWTDTLRKIDENAPPSREQLDRRAAEQRRAASAERRARNRADQAEWDAPPASGGAPEPNPYEEPVAWVETLRDVAETTAAGLPTSASDHPQGKQQGSIVVPMQPASQFRKSVDAESKIAAQVRADKELYKARLKEERRNRREQILNPAYPGGTFTSSAAAASDAAAQRPASRWRPPGRRRWRRRLSGA